MRQARDCSNLTARGSTVRPDWTGRVGFRCTFPRLGTGPTALLVSALSAVAPAAFAEETSPVVRIQQGWLRGTRGDGVDRFLAIPYAAPPVGPLRWKPPATPQPWRGMRSATAYPPRCAQFGSEGPGDEDCLYLDLYRPSHSRGWGLPVLFFIHGGAFKVGSAIDDDPSRIAATTDSVVVMINYRLGQFGFLTHPALSAETPDGTSGDYGLMDQQAALRWVQEEIRAFGGDPKNVTIAGASAGAISVCAHLASPSAAGLFTGAVIQSGACFARPWVGANAEGITFANAVGCPDTNSAACLRQKTTAELLAGDSFSINSGPVIGARLLPEAPFDVITGGTFTKVPVMIGGVRDEARAGAASLYPMTAEAYLSFLDSSFGALAPSVLEVYPVSAYPTPFDAFAAVVNDSGLGGIGSCRTLNLTRSFAAVVPTYAYEFDDQTAPVPTWVTMPPGLVLGASHSSDEAYWFDRPFDAIQPRNATQSRLAQQMISYLGAFVERKTPQVWGQPYWPRFEETRQRVLRFAPGQIGVRTDFAAEHHCAFWSSIGTF